MFGNKCQLMSARLVVQRIWNCSLLKAIHWKCTPVPLTVMLLNAGAELLVLTRMANVLVALFAGTPLSVTTVMRILVWPSCADVGVQVRSEEHTSELQSLRHLVCRRLL